MLAQGYILKIKCALWKGLGNHLSSEGSIPKKREWGWIVMIVFASKINENILPLPPQINYMQFSGH